MIDKFEEQFGDELSQSAINLFIRKVKQAEKSASIHESIDPHHDVRVEFVEGWCEANLHDFNHIEEAEEVFWEDLEHDPENMAEVKRLGLTKEIAYDIMQNTADNMGMND